MIRFFSSVSPVAFPGPSESPFRSGSWPLSGAGPRPRIGYIRSTEGESITAEDEP